MDHYSSQADVVDDVQRAGVVHVEEKNMDDTLFPEGGWQAWITIVGAYVDHTRLMAAILLQYDNRFLVQFATFG